MALCASAATAARFCVLFGWCERERETCVWVRGAGGVAMGRERYGPVERENGGRRGERGAKCVDRRDSRAGARHRGTQRHVVATGGVSRARAFGYGLCECVCVVSNKRFAKFDTRTHNNTERSGESCANRFAIRGIVDR